MGKLNFNNSIIWNKWFKQVILNLKSQTVIQQIDIIHITINNKLNIYKLIVLL